MLPQARRGPPLTQPAPPRRACDPPLYAPPLSSPAPSLSPSNSPHGPLPDDELSFAPPVGAVLHYRLARPGSPSGGVHVWRADRQPAVPEHLTVREFATLSNLCGRLGVPLLIRPQPEPYR